MIGAIGRLGCREVQALTTDDPDEKRIEVDLRADVTVRKEPDGDGLLLVRDNRGWITWALLAFSSTDGVRTQYDVLARGEGTGGCLREARHTWFGDAGYVFYIDAKLLAWGLEQLKEWFEL